jgi:hypothetical protein
MPANVALASECLVAISGVFPARPLRAGDASEAKALPGRWRQAVADFFAAKRPARAGRSPALSYLRIWRQLNGSQDDDSVAAKLAAPDVAQAYKDRLAGARDYLRGQWRPLRLRGFVGARLLDPAQSERERGADLFAVVDRPGRMLERLASGSVLEEEVEAFRAVYPELAAMLDSLVQVEIIRLRARRQSWEPTFWQEQALRALGGLPPDQPVAAIEANAGGEEAPAEPPSIDVKMRRTREESQTKTDRLAEGSAA